MKKIFKKNFFNFFLFFFKIIILFADIPHFLDFKYILNESDAGKKAQDFLKKKLEKWYKKY